MDENRIQESKVKLTELNEFISKLDIELKQKALEILLPLYFETEDVPPKTPKLDNDTMGEINIEDEQEFFSSFNHDKPAENVVMIAAWLYSQYGVYPITPEEVKGYATRLGITIASRTDNTLRTVARKEKNLFHQVGKGWEPTLPGEKFFKETYKVRKGNNPRPTIEE